ncbi:Gluconokinase [Thermosinus carboxydivorans Nor1]|uniref:Gluconokinase n=1 Tax=Thermosinus carboxydivorans Nor1 TaxID=401526 RepID=A1HMS4_9FIRM|nr:gluconokinase [Thermosinus carboxydivorans]EAX48561.1 Gluconokinase [Thermosinus carboxydivorans Nor1]
MQVIIGVDIGTTGCRAAVYREDGVALANQSLEYPLYTPQAAWAEQDPDEIFQAVLTVTARAVQQAALPPKTIAGLCFSSVFHSFIPVDKDGAPLGRMLTWADSRSQSYTEELKRHHDAQAIYERTGCPLHPMYPLSKVLWLRHERPDLFRRAARFISIKEYILYRFLGKYVVDRSIASGTGLYNIHDRCWDGELMELLGLTEDQLSPVAATTSVEGPLLPAIADRLGISPATPVVLGAGDGVLSSVGSGAVLPGQLTAMIGTSGAVRVVTDKPAVDPKGRTWCYNLTDEYWVLGGAINNGGIAFRWARDKFAATEQFVAEKLSLDPYEILSRYAEQKPAGSDGLIMLPFFTGERAPYWNANARGVLFGLNLNHGKRHLIRATLEGICYRMYSIFTALEEVAGRAEEIRVSGSFTRSRLWVQIMADVFGRPISVPGEPEGSAFGAAILGMTALGILGNIKEVTKFINIKEQYLPNERHHERYQRLYAIYERIYWNLQKEFEEIARIQREWAEE